MLEPHRGVYYHQLFRHRYDLPRHRSCVLCNYPTTVFLPSLDGSPLPVIRAIVHSRTGGAGLLVFRLFFVLLFRLGSYLCCTREMDVCDTENVRVRPGGHMWEMRGTS